MINLKNVKRLNIVFSLTLFAGLFLFSCSSETCTDGILNQDETAVDCGGVCTACESCTDGILNQDETAIDCGGVCSPCETCSDGIQNQDETGVDCGGVCTPCATPALCSTSSFSASIDGTTYNATFIYPAYQMGNLVIGASNVSTHSINLVLDTTMVPGTYNITSGMFANPTEGGAQYSSLGGGSTLYSATSGTLVITEHDPVIDGISGTFSFDALESGGVGTVSVTSGSFCVNY